MLERLITPRTKAILPVHYAGVGCEMDAILEIAARHDIPVVEDNAHGLFAKYRGQNLGTFGAFATQSFHETKNIVCGEGGALLINDTEYIERAEIIREKGTNRSRFFRGQVDKYTWVDAGSSYLPSELLAAFLYAQLEAHEEIQAKRRRIWEYYAETSPRLGAGEWCATAHHPSPLRTVLSHVLHAASVPGATAANDQASQESRDYQCLSLSTVAPYRIWGGNLAVWKETARLRRV